MLPDNLGYLFDSALALTPSKAAVLQGDTVLTFAELDARANRMANVLAGLGVGAWDRVALLFNNDFRFLETLFGAMRLGAVAVPLNIRMGDEALRYVAEDSEAHVLVASAALAERGRALASRIPAIKELIADGPAAEDVLAYEPALASASPTLPRRATAFPSTTCVCSARRTIFGGTRRGGTRTGECSRHRASIASCCRSRASWEGLAWLPSPVSAPWAASLRISGPPICCRYQ